MTQAIWKFPLGLTDQTMISMPAGAEVLCVQTQGGAPNIWALVRDIGAGPMERVFKTYGTGHPHASIPGRYIGTYQLMAGGIIFHVFEESP